MDLWADVYRPQHTSEVVGQNKSVEQALAWMQSWKPGTGLLLVGPAGTGKTSLAEAIASENNKLLLHMNASDRRKAEDIEHFAEGTKAHDLFGRKKLILIDEVDSISGQERGAAKAIIQLIKQSAFPVILTANDEWNKKIRSLKTYCTVVRFGKVHAASLEKRLREIAEKEGKTCEDGLLKSLARWSGGDMRSALNDLHLVFTGKNTITLKDLEALGFRERKGGIFDILPSIFSGRSLSAAKKNMYASDKDQDEILLWVEQNSAASFSEPHERKQAYERLAAADMFRNYVFRQQNWRFKAYMTDLIASVAVGRQSKQGWIRYQPPQKLIQLGRSRSKRSCMNNLTERLGKKFHCSRRQMRRDILPYLSFLLKHKALDLPLEKEERALLR